MKKKKSRLRTYPRARTHTALMGCGGKGKPSRVIEEDGRLMQYVGIGWIEIRQATKADRKRYPKLVD